MFNQFRRELRKKLAFVLSVAMLVTTFVPLMAYTAPEAYAGGLPSDGQVYDNVNNTGYALGGSGYGEEDAGEDYFQNAFTGNLSGSGSYTIASKSDLQNYIASGSNSETKIVVNGKELENGMTLNNGDTISIDLAWSFKNRGLTISEGTKFYYVLPETISFDDKSGEIYAGSTAIGSYNISGNLLTVTYHDLGADSEISSKVHIDGKVYSKAAQGGNGGTITFDFPGIGTYTDTITRDTSEDGLTIKKQGPFPDGCGAQERYYVLKLTAVGTNSNATVSDSMGNSLYLEDVKNISIYTNAECTQECKNSYKISDQNTHGFNVNFKELVNETIYIKYYITFDNGAYLSEDSSRTNTVIASSSNTSKVSTDTAILKLDKTWASKVATLSNGNDIKWTILVNQGDSYNIAGLKIKENLNSEMSYDTSNSTNLNIMEYSGSKHSFSSDDSEIYDNSKWTEATNKNSEKLTTTWDILNGAGYQFPNDGKEYTGIYKISFKVKMNKVPYVDEHTFENQIQYSFDGTDWKYGNTGKIGVGTDEGVLKKTCLTTASNAKYIKWQTVIKVPKNKTLTKASLTDTIAEGHTLYKNGSNPLITITDSEFPLALGTDYTIKSGNDGASSFQIDFLKALYGGANGKTLTIQYWTKINETNYDQSRNYDNNASLTAEELYELESSASYTFMPLKKEDISVSKNANDPFTWRLTIGVIPENGEKVIIKDVLPLNTNYIKDSISIEDSYKNDISVATWNDAATGKEVVQFDIKDGGTLFTALKSTSVPFSFKTQITDLKKIPADISTEKTLSFINEATISFKGDGVNTYTASATHDVNSNGTLTKAVTYNRDVAPLAKYAININSGAIDIVPDVDSISLTDTLPSALDLIMGTITVNSVDTGNKDVSVTEKSVKEKGYLFNYDSDTRLMSLTVPDSKAIIFKYNTLVTLPVGAQLDERNSLNQVDFTGSASGAGSGSAGLGIAVLDSNASGKFTNNAISIYKFNNDDESDPLGGATFEVRNMDFSEESAKGTLNKVWDVTASTSALGSLTSSAETTGGNVMGMTKNLGPILNDHIYRIIETKLPAGDYSPIMPYYFVFEGTDGYDYSDVSVSDNGQIFTLNVIPYAGNKTDVSNPVYTQKIFHFGNYDSNNLTEFKVTKTWVDNQNSEKTRPDKITVYLQQTTDGSTWTAVSGSEKKLTVDKDHNSKEYIWTNLPKKKAGKEVKYRAVENPVAGYDTVTEADPLNPAYSEIITNTRNSNPLIEKTVQKLWDDDNNANGFRPDSITVALYANGSNTNKDVVLNEANGWKATWSNLEKYSDLTSGTSITYSVAEKAFTNSNKYSSATVGNGDSFVITNTFGPAYTARTVTKVWDDNNNSYGLRPDSVTIHLYADGTDTGKSLVLNEANAWTGNFTHLDKYSNWQNQTEITYTIEEDAVASYTTSVAAEGISSFIVTNTHSGSTTPPGGNGGGGGGNTPGGNTPTVPNGPGVPSQPGNPSNPYNGGNGTPPRGSGPVTSLTNIGNGDVPLYGYNPDGTEIIEGDIPRGNLGLPKTGEEAKSSLLVLAIMSLLTALGAVLLTKKKEL